MPGCDECAEPENGHGIPALKIEQQIGYENGGENDEHSSVEEMSCVRDGAETPCNQRGQTSTKGGCGRDTRWTGNGRTAIGAI
jgi:hypothetical protein